MNADSQKNTAAASCSKCDGTGWVVGIVGEGEEHYTPKGRLILPGQSYAYPCPECGSKVQLGGTGIPSKYAHKGYERENFWNVYDKDCTAYIKAVNSYVDRQADWNYGLYIYSDNRGTGKTKLACSILTSLRVKDNLSVRFVSVPDYLYQLRRSFKDNAPTMNEKTQDLLRADILCLDDLGAEKRSEWTDQELFYLIDTRYTSGRKTIITSNYSMDNLTEDARLCDRIREICIPLHMPEECIRNEKAHDRQSAFLRRMGIV